MDDRNDYAVAARRVLTQRLESLQRAGVQQLGKTSAVVGPHEALQMAARQMPTADVPPPISNSPSPRPVALSLSLTDHYRADLPGAKSDRQQLLDELNNQVRACALCRDLACSRKQTVFGVGSAKPRVVFFGEAPGADEDRQ